MPNVDQLLAKIRQLKPWHHNIQLIDSVSIADAFRSEELEQATNNNVGFVNLKERFNSVTTCIYPAGLQGKSFLDCACNGGGYCFLAREYGASTAFGFDVREHWIKQAEFVRKHRTVAPTDNIRFAVCDVMDLPSVHHKPADFTLFKGIFYHLADPIAGLKIAADFTTEVLWVETAIKHSDGPDGLRCKFEPVDPLMSGVDGLSWLPNGPGVIAQMLFWLGFTDVWHVYTRQATTAQSHDRTGVIASRIPGQLDGLSSIAGAHQFTKPERCA